VVSGSEVIKFILLMICVLGLGITIGLAVGFNIHDQTECVEKEVILYSGPGALLVAIGKTKFCGNDIHKTNNYFPDSYEWTGDEKLHRYPEED
jgi:hypothetical protein